MNHNIKYIISVFLLAFLSSGFAQQQEDFVQYTVNDGLPSNTVYQALQDKKGYMWFATEGGVAKFDGREFKVFTVKDGLPTNDIWQMVEDEMGRIWLMGMSNVASYIENDIVYHFENLTEDIGTGLVKLSDISFDDGIKLFYYSYFIKVDKDLNQRVYRTAKLSPHFVSLLEVVNSNHKFYESVPIEGGYIILMENMTLLYNDLTNEVDTLYEPSVFLNRRSVIYNNSYLMGDYFFVPSSERNSLNVLRINPTFRLDGVIKLDTLLGGIPSHLRFVMQDDKLQIQTNLGVLVLDFLNNTIDDNMPVYPTPIDYDPTFVNRVFVDKEENIWTCTNNQGVGFNAKKITEKRHRVNDFGEKLTSIILHDDNFYLGSASGKLIVVGESNRVIDFHSNEADNSLSKLSYDTLMQKICFIKDGMGLVYYDEFSKESFPLFDLDGNINNDCDVNIDYTYSYDNTKRQLQYNKLTNPESYSIEDSYVYYCSSSLIVKVDRVDCEIDTVLYTGHDDLIINDSTYYLIHKDYITISDNDFNVLNKNVFDNSIVDTKPYKDGILVLLDNSDLVYLNLNEQLIYKYNTLIKPSNCTGLYISDQIWISTNSGLYTYSRDDMNLNLERFEVFAGVNDVIFYGDSLCTATDYGLVKSSLADNDNIEIDIPIYLKVTDLLDTELIINDTELKYDENNLKLHFAILDYSSIAEYELDLKLISQDTVLIKTNESSVTLPNLASGYYTLEYFVVDNYGRNSNVYTVNFTISKPWWSRPIAIICYVILILLASTLIYWLSMRRLKRREALKINTAKKMAELRLSALQSQMNPHFIFNSLNSIQHLIQIKDSHNADKYLSKFSELLRSFLENSREKFVPINNEIQLLLNYCNLEILRFENKIKLRYSNELSAEDQLRYLIPTSILQPIVENAIVHGLFHKENEGLLSIEVRIVNKELQVKVKDNGIGRVKSNELNVTRYKGHKSLASQMILEKLEVLEKISSYKASIQYIDLIDNNKESLGTEVIVSLPLIEAFQVDN